MFNGISADGLNEIITQFEKKRKKRNRRVGKHDISLITHKTTSG